MLVKLDLPELEKKGLVGPAYNLIVKEHVHKLGEIIKTDIWTCVVWWPELGISNPWYAEYLSLWSE